MKPENQTKNDTFSNKGHTLSHTLNTFDASVLNGRSNLIISLKEILNGIGA